MMTHEEIWDMDLEALKAHPLFKKFQATGEFCADIGAHPSIRDEVLEGIAGRLYCDGLYLEDVQSWQDDNPEAVQVSLRRGRWYTIIDRSEYQSDDLVDVEARLFQFALSERIIS